MTATAKTTVTVKYWVGTTRREETATTYTGAMKIASKNQNSYEPKFFDANGVQVYDLGNVLAYEPNEAGETIVLM